MDINEIRKKYILALPKVIDHNGCWISNLKPEKDGHIRIMINYTRYVLSRLSLSVFHNVDYFDNSTLARHKCNNPACFNPEHVQVGSHSDNMMDSVAAKTHIHASKDVCPKCGGPYIKNLNSKKQVWSRRCNKCKQARRKELRAQK